MKKSHVPSLQRDLDEAREELTQEQLRKASELRRKANESRKVAAGATLAAEKHKKKANEIESSVSESCKI